MKTFDIDGTLLDYDYLVGEDPVINQRLIVSLDISEPVALVTNQGGLAFGLMDAKRRDGRQYPRPVDFVWRLNKLINYLTDAGIPVVSVYVCTFHAKAPAELCREAAATIKEMLPNDIVKAYSLERWRKPNPAMLIEAGATVYYGDSEEDGQAAAAAGIPFVKVERFTSGGGGQPINLIECLHCGRKDKVIINDRERWCPECGKKRVYYVAVDEMRPPFNSQLWLAHEPLQEYPDEAEMVQAFIEDLYPDKVDIAFGSARAWVVDRLDDEAPARCYEVRVDYVPTWFAYEIDQGST